MRVILDTNVVSELRKIGAGRADPAVSKWAGSRSRDDMYLSAITLFEVEVGIRRLQARDHVQAAMLRAWLDGKILVEFERRILPIDSEVARQAARAVAEWSLPLADALIAATGLVHGLSIATRNVRHFTRVSDLTVINPWDAL